MAAAVTRLKPGAKRALAGRLGGRLAARAAAARGHALVVLHHRVGEGPSDHEVVETVAVDGLRRQLRSLAELGDILPLGEVLSGPGTGRPRIALTFDDDYRSHFSIALPLLVELGLPATFFLGGRSLHQLGAYWWEALERRIAADGVEATARELGVEGARSPAALAAACEGTAIVERLTAEGGAVEPHHLSPAELRRLADAPGIAIGFHTLHHPLLPAVGDAELSRAVSVGRDALEAHLGRPLVHFAYPHGKAGAREAAAVRRAEYHAAFTGRFGPVRVDQDPFLLSRWEPHHLVEDAFRSTAAARLHRDAPPPHPA